MLLVGALLRPSWRGDKKQEINKHNHSRERRRFPDSVPR
jgi:hypothetical protein